MTWGAAVVAVYLVVLGVLSLNGLHRLWLLWVVWRHVPAPPAAEPAVWPRVTVQLPVFDERFVVERLIRVCAALDYPRDRLSLQVLDDSTDDTTAIAARVVAELAGEGLDIALVHRTDRTGFKAGALDAGLATAQSELIAIFDADFLPPADFLRRVVPAVAPGVGMVQARWGHLNAADSWLTTAESVLLDGHFLIEHAGRNWGGRWFNFNGTAGIWRREAIVDAGGWQHDTLTEDLDLSYRAQLRGWRFVYLPDVVAPAELPADMPAFKQQQHRWAKGSIQTCRKLLGRIWRSPVALPLKLEATAHLTANFSYPLVIALTLLLPFTIVARVEGLPPWLLGLDAVLFLGAIGPFALFYGVAIFRAGSPDPWRRVRRLPIVLALGIGLAVAQSRAVLEGLGGRVGEFVRTPKSGGATSGYRVTHRQLAGLELLLSGYTALAGLYAATHGYAASLPFLALFAGGYGAVGVASLRR